MVFLITVVLSLSGCGTVEEDTSDVSAEKRLLGRGPGLNIERGDLKESGVVFEDGSMEFQDPVVEEMLRNIIGKPEGDVYISELQDIHAIYWRSESHYWSNLQSPDGCLPHISGNESPWEAKQPNSLEDLAYCYNLQWMEFGEGIEVPSLKPLYQLPQLETLSFSGANITEEVLAEIGELPVLNCLELGHYDYVYGLGTNWGDITDGSFILPLADQLTSLDAMGGIDWNPEVLAQMTKLERLGIDYADDLSFLEQLTDLKKLSMYCCTPEDWSTLSSLENLEHLEVRGNMYTIIDIELDDLRPLKSLDYLEVAFTSINEEHSRQEIIDAIPSLTGLVKNLYN